MSGTGEKLGLEIVDASGPLATLSGASCIRSPGTRIVSGSAMSGTSLKLYGLVSLHEVKTVSGLIDAHSKSLAGEAEPHESRKAKVLNSDHFEK
jgi:hypothetical protein